MSSEDHSPHILNTSATLLGLCFVVLTSIRALDISAATLIDELATVAIVMFMASCILSFLSMRKYASKGEKLEKMADIFFLGGLGLLFITAMAISFNLIK